VDWSSMCWKNGRCLDACFSRHRPNWLHVTQLTTAQKYRSSCICATLIPLSSNYFSLIGMITQ
jgi:hypothetical protein